MELLIYLPTIARLFIAFTYVFAGFSSLYHFNLKSAVLRKRCVPFPIFFTWFGILLQIYAGLAVMFNFYVIIGACALIIFTVVANFIFHDFWNAQGDSKRLKLQSMNTSIGLTGGLLFLILWYSQ